MTEQHSPTPWRTFLFEHTTPGQSPTWLIEGAGGLGDLPVDRCGIFKEADAAFIVEAVNSHAELMSALQQAVRWMAQHNDFCPLDDEGDAVLAAIDRAVQAGPKDAVPVEPDEETLKRARQAVDDYTATVRAEEWCEACGGIGCNACGGWGKKPVAGGDQT